MIMINCISYGIMPLYIYSIHVYCSKLIWPFIPFYNHSIFKIFTIKLSLTSEQCRWTRSLIGKLSLLYWSGGGGGQNRRGLYSLVNSQLFKYILVNKGLNIVHYDGSPRHTIDCYEALDEYGTCFIF